MQWCFCNHAIYFIYYLKGKKLYILLQLMEINLRTEFELTQEKIRPNQDKPSRLMELEGECKIHSIRPLKIDWVKSILLIIPIIGSIVGLLLLKYFKSVRVAAFYKDVGYDEADYVFIEGTGEVQDIEDVIRQRHETFFFFKKLKYFIHNHQTIPAGFLYQEEYDTFFNKAYFGKGTNEQIRTENERKFGRNQHKVDIPNYFEFIFEVMTKPFFLLQYVICVIFIFEGLLLYAIIYVVFSILTTSANYILLYISFKKIQAIAEKETQVKAIRDGREVSIKNTDLLPGDLYIPQKNTEVPCDAILVQGEVYVNEASLTGQSIPVGKFALNRLEEAKQQNRWLYEGAKTLECRANALGLVVNVGYATRRGRIIRKILTRNPKQPDFFITVVLFLLETLTVGIIIYFATLNIMVTSQVSTQYQAFRFLDILGWSFPPTFPIFFNLAYSFSLTRLRLKGIIGTQPQKTMDGAKLKTMCFDKTGTLTQNAVEVHEIIKFHDEDHKEDITQAMDNPNNLLIRKLFACCHTVKNIDGEFLGDEVDLRMYLYSTYTMINSDKPEIKFIAEKDSIRLEILRINQFESKFQNMSVLVRDPSQNKYYAFVKGAPERIDRNSTLKVKAYESIVSGLSLGGYRTIGYGYREVLESEIAAYLNGPRDVYESNIRVLGLVAFENKLKGDTRDTILRLIESDIEPKMITGDNIFIAVETGVRAGILKRQEKIVLLEGRKQNFTGSDRKFRGKLLERTETETKETDIELDQKTQYLNCQYSIAIDNDFLKLKPEPVLTNKIKLFARISPENKALVVKKYKQQVDEDYDRQGCISKFFGAGKFKVGMCGDGANDLMAIRESDLGLGISDSDASYGASFSIVNMLDVDAIVRQSKNASQAIVDMVRYFGTVSFLKIITAVILSSDSAYFQSNQITYFNFAHTVWLAILLGLSNPLDTPTKRRPVTNMMSLQNHFIYWINIILPTIGFALGFQYYYTRSYFIANAHFSVNGIYSVVNQSTTVIWLMINLPFIINAVNVYNGVPFKTPFFKNILLMIMTIANLIPAIVFFFFTASLSKLSLVAISPEDGGIIFAIMMASLIVSFILNRLIQWFINSRADAEILANQANPKRNQVKPSIE